MIQMYRLTDAYGREARYLRLSLTDKCNLRCRYCMPEEGICHMLHEDILSFEEIVRLCRIFTSMGIGKIRLTGGEPFVRKDMMKLVSMICKECSDVELALTTNGILLGDHIDELVTMGIRDINISLDTLRPDVYKDITGVDALDRVTGNIKLAYESGMNIKINCVPISGINDEDIIAMAGYTKDMDIKVRFIELMPIGNRSDLKGIPSSKIIEEISKCFGILSPVISEYDHQIIGPAKYYSSPVLEGQIGIISPMTDHFCSSCNRIRLTCDGMLKTCLANDNKTDLKSLIRQGRSDNEIAERILSAYRDRPKEHALKAGSTSADNMYEIGG